MPRQCSICTRPDAAEIDSAILGAETYRSIANRLGVSRASIGRHAAHVRARLQAATVPECLPPPASLAEFFRSRRIAELSPAATLREHAIRDVCRLEALLEAAVVSGNVAAVLAVLRTKYIVVERSGLVDRLDEPLTSVSGVASDDARGQVLARMGRT